MKYDGFIHATWSVTGSSFSRGLVKRTARQTIIVDDYTDISLLRIYDYSVASYILQDQIVGFPYLIKPKDFIASDRIGFVGGIFKTLPQGFVLAASSNLPPQLTYRLCRPS